MRTLVLTNGQFEERNIENTLEALQSIVGGYIEIPYLSNRFAEEEIDVIINEEGKLIGLEPQIVVVREDDSKVLDVVVGNCIFASHNEDGETIGLTDKQIEVIKEELKLEVFLGIQEAFLGVQPVRALFI